MVQIAIKHRFPWPRDIVWATLDSAAYTAARTKHTLDRPSTSTLTLLFDGEENGMRVRRVRHVLNREVPRMMQKFTGATEMAYVVKETIHPAQFRVDWTATPEVARGGQRISRNVEISGSYGFNEVPGEPGICERFVNATVRVAIPALGGRIEQGIASGLRKTHEESAEFALTFLQERLG